MKKIALLAFALLGCSGGPQSMAWSVDCARDTPASLYDRWIEESPNYCDSELEPDESYSMCEEWMRVRYRYEWAKAEYRKRCEREA